MNENNENNETIEKPELSEQELLIRRLELEHALYAAKSNVAKVKLERERIINKISQYDASVASYTETMEKIEKELEELIS